MKKIILILSLICTSVLWCNAQSSTVVVGGEATGNGGSASFTAGDVFYTSKSGNGLTSTDGVQQGIGANPTAVISGTNSICNGSAASLSIAFTGVGPWTGALSDGTPFTTSNNPYSINVSPTSTTTYTVASLTDQNGTAVAADLTGSASVNVTVSQPAPTALACYETATFNTTTCSWDVTGSQPSLPTLACYETATFNTTTCVWDVTGTQIAMPTLACYQTASFNTTTCDWDVTGTQIAMPTLACYQTASFNGTTCVWDVTGSQPAMPTLACYETASFNGQTCVWDVTINGGSTSFYVDADGDGFGNVASYFSEFTCLGVVYPGYVLNSDDCDDTPGTGAAINPNATEICGNNIDDNCNGLIDENCPTCVNAPAALAGADQTICGTASVTLAGSLVNSSAGSWSTSGTGTFSPSATVANATYIPSNADRTAESVTLTWCTTDAVSPCVDACDAIDIFFANVLAGPGPITGSLQLCNPTPTAIYTLSVTPAPGATSYTWSVPAGVTIVAGQGTTTLFVSFSSNSIQNGVVGAVSVQANNTTVCGASAPSTAFMSVQLVAPVTPGSISGPLKVCPGDAPSTFSVASVARAGLYTWTVPTGATIVSGQGSQVITVSFGAGFVGGNMSVVASNGCGASTVRNRTVFLNTLPAPAGISGFVNGICGAVGAVYSITAPVTGALSYQWSVPANVSITSNTGNSITVDFLPGFTSGNISVVAVNNCGNSVARTITVNGYPATIGAISGATPACLGSINLYSISSVTGASNYNWLVSNGNALPIQPSSSAGIGQGSKNIEIRTNAAGIIAVNASNACGIGRNQNLSVTTVFCPRIGDATAGLNLVAYPNPTSDVLNVAFTSEKDEYYTLRLLDVTGRVVMTDAKVATEGQNQVVVMVKGLASGIYSLQFQMNEKSETIRIFVN
jgi:hypothetical protein